MWFGFSVILNLNLIQRFMSESSGLGSRSKKHIITQTCGLVKVWTAVQVIPGSHHFLFGWESLLVCRHSGAVAPSVVTSSHSWWFLIWRSLWTEAGQSSTYVSMKTNRLWSVQNSSWCCSAERSRRSLRKTWSWEEHTVLCQSYRQVFMCPLSSSTSNI